MKTRGLYIIKDSFFDFANDPYLKGNKKNNRPHYYCFEDEKSGLYWVIPLSSKVDKYRRIEKQKMNKNGKCDIIHIMKLDNNKESVFLIQDMFPISEDFVLREYTIQGNHLMVSSEHQAEIIRKKAKKVKKLLKKGIKLTPTQVDINRIESKLIDKLGGKIDEI